MGGALERIRRVKFVRRFSRTERTLHWVNAAGFLLLLATGLILYLPRLSTVVGRRPLIKDVHLWGGIGWIAALAIVIVLGDRRGLLRTARDLEVLRPSRLNVGQKVNALLNAAFAVLFLVSGLLLWFGERDTRFRFTSTVLLHDILMYAALTLLVGHLYLALIHPATRHSLRGMTRGTVREDWAKRHYPRWAPPPAD
jgi:formate dehydrogenase subunit gamma